VRGTHERLRAIEPPHDGRPSMNAWMIWLASASALLLFAYLVYALLRAEDLE
jgi:K+-transporting ATPase KdpF subunit